MVCLRQQGGVLSLIECTLIEEPDANDEDGEPVSLTHIFKSAEMNGDMHH